MKRISIAETRSNAVKTRSKRAKTAWKELNRVEPKNKGGGRNSCVACGHPDRQDLNQQLAAGISLRKLSARYGISVSSLSKHHSNHMSRSEFATIKRARNGASSKSPKSALARIEDGLIALEDLMSKSAKNRETTLYLTAYRERLRTHEIIGKARGEFTDAPTITVNLHRSPEWQQIRRTIFEVLAELPEVRATLAKRLMVLEGGANGTTRQDGEPDDEPRDPAK